MGRPRVLTDEQRKERQKEYLRKYWLANKEKIKAVRKKNPNNAEYHKRWAKENREHLNKYHREWRAKRKLIDKKEQV